jgi:uroporphyrinogen decarboxylase
MPIVPLYLRGGINCMFPVEVAAGSDPLEIRRRFGEEVLLHGGINKRALIKGFREIEDELERVKPLVEEGGYVPHVDHRCPADVPLKNYKYYLKLKRDLFEAGDLMPYYKE